MSVENTGLCYINLYRHVYFFPLQVFECCRMQLRHRGGRHRLRRRSGDKTQKLAVNRHEKQESVDMVCNSFTGLILKI